MLYDNALITINYAEAYQITGRRFYLDVMQKTLDFVLRDMALPAGAFCSAYDADSEGVEGRYYTWRKSEILDVLGPGADADLFCLYYDVTDGGNWEGETILCNSVALSTASFKLGMSEDAARTSLAESASKLLRARERLRAPPDLDRKMLVSWNALFVTALAKGHRVSGRAEYLDAAKRCISFIESEMLRDGRLLRTYKDGQARIDGYLEDYAYLACALLDVFELEPDARYLESAVLLGRVLLDEFWDADSGSFYMTGGRHESLVVRPRSQYDLSVPSGNSVAAFVMLRLYHITGRQGFLDVCLKAARFRARDCAENPFAFGYMLNVISMLLAGPREITVLDSVGGRMRDMIRSAYLPDSFVVEVDDPARLERLSAYPFFAGKTFDQGAGACAYICKDSVCSMPMRDPDEVRAALNLSEV